MLVIPAIDLKDGRCVRLFRGDYRQVTVFSEDPPAVARQWRELGAELLHFVDLDGAAAGHPRHLDVVRAAIRASQLPVQFGGGIRSLDTLDQVFAAGVTRAILGTAAVEDRDLVAEAVRRWGDRIAVGIDAKNGWVATRGWMHASKWRVIDLAAELAVLGVSRFIYTDINRDGTLTEPNYATTANLVREIPARVIASGGVSHFEHLLRLRDIGVEGAIVGRALYTGALDLREAIRALGAPTSG